jgi:hypothetical protein
MTASTTKAARTAKPVDQSQLIHSLQAQVAELQAQAESRDELSQILWLNDRYSFARTQAGKQLVRFSAQKSTQKQDGTRSYGPYKNFVCYNEELVEQISEILQSNDRLVRVNGFESPWTDNSKRSDWVVTAISVIPRVAPENEPSAPTQEQQVPFSADPTDEKVPF